jgi:hypothetical protein
VAEDVGVVAAGFFETVGQDRQAVEGSIVVEGEAVFEVVYTYDWYDGPRQSIADFHGNPHVFQSEWNDDEDLYADSFLLLPIDRDTFLLALEDWAIWRRWETAFHQGKAAKDTHPALPQDRGRHEELQRLLDGRLVVDPAHAVRMRAEFRVREDPESSGHGSHPLEVRWEELS